MKKTIKNYCNLLTEGYPGGGFSKINLIIAPDLWVVFFNKNIFFFLLSHFFTMSGPERFVSTEWNYNALMRYTEDKMFELYLIIKNGIEKTTACTIKEKLLARLDSSYKKNSKQDELMDVLKLMVRVNKINSSVW